MSFKYVSATEAKEWLDSNEAVIIDVREKDEYEAEKIEGAINHPLSDIDPALFLQQAHGKKCIVQCVGGKRASKACDHLFEFSDQIELYVLENGLKAWKGAGFDTEKKGLGISIFRQVQIIAGFFILLGTILGMTCCSIFLLLPLFFGAGLLFAGVTGWCGMGILLQKMPWNKSSKKCGTSCKL